MPDKDFPDIKYFGKKMEEKLKELVATVGPTPTDEAKLRLAAEFKQLAEDNTTAVLLGELAENIHALHVAKGFYDEPRTVSHLMGLVMTELAEIVEDDRKFVSATPSEKIPEFTKEEEEVADAVIRLLDFAGQRGLRIGSAILAKHAYNGTRPPLHGKRY